MVLRADVPGDAGPSVLSGGAVGPESPTDAEEGRADGAR